MTIEPVDQVLEQRPHRRQHRLAAGAVDERRLPGVEAARFAAPQRQFERRRGFGFGGVDADAGLARAHHRADARQQPAAAERGDHGIDVGQVFEDLEARRRVAGDEIIVVERMHEVAAHARRCVRFDGLPAFVVARP